MISSYDDFTATNDPNGMCALFEFTGALPRAKLYANWQVSTNDEAVLQQLASPAFDPHKSIFVAGPASAPPQNADTNQDAGTVEITSYAPKNIALKADARAPCMLLYNDRFDPDWKVSVDGKPVELLRANYIMRGVYLTPGQHTVEMHFRPKVGPLYVTLAAIVIGLGVLGFVSLDNLRKGRGTVQSS
jgi:hypothetical protein